MKEKEKSWLPVAGLTRDRVGELPSQEESNKELEAIKCLLKQFSISDLSDIGVESTAILGGSSEEQVLAERDFMVCQNFLGSFKLSEVCDK